MAYYTYQSQDQGVVLGGRKELCDNMPSALEALAAKYGMDEQRKQGMDKEPFDKLSDRVLGDLDRLIAVLETTEPGAKTTAKKGFLVAHLEQRIDRLKRPDYPEIDSDDVPF